MCEWINKKNQRCQCNDWNNWIELEDNKLYLCTGHIIMFDQLDNKDKKDVIDIINHKYQVEEFDESFVW